MEKVLDEAARGVFGTQVWLEEHDTPERVEHLFRSAAESGIGWVRLFLMWPWIERVAGEFKFGVFDLAFESAARHGIKIKATLTANSGPWHVGTPLALHTHTGFLSEAQRGPMREYIRQCVTRYAKHPALGQWILWNEPLEPGTRGEVALAFWRGWLERRYGGKIAELNERWLTGFGAFGEIPFPEEIAHEKHRKSHWLSYGPWIDDWKCRAAWLVDELAWVKAIVREFDGVTPTCVNPPGNLGNLAVSGTDLTAMGAGVEVLGASFHPAWTFVYADRWDYPALIATGVRQMVGLPGVKRVEVTEVQTGNTTESSVRPNEVTAGEIARFHLAGLAAGAESVTGWCFNVRQPDNEAGDWALLDDDDLPSGRSRMLRRVAGKLAEVRKVTRAWRGAAAQAVVLSSPDSQAIEMIAGKDAYMTHPGRRANDGPQGASLLAVRLMRLGVSTTVAQPAYAAGLVQEGGLVVASHVTSWDRGEMGAILDAVREKGATLLVDGISGRRDHDAKLHHPWPGELAGRLGIEAGGLETRDEGWGWRVEGIDAGRAALTRMGVRKLSAEWKAWGGARFSDDVPCVVERSYGAGRVVMFRGLLGATLLAGGGRSAGVEWLLRQVAPGAEVVPVGGGVGAFAVAVPVGTERGRLVAVLAPDRVERGGGLLRLVAGGGTWRDLWSGTACERTIEGELVLAAEEGVALLWRED